MMNLSSPVLNDLPQHVAIVMDGNGRWAEEHGQPRLVGHSAGVKALKRCVQACLMHGIRYLTVFAFSSENWRRPPDEVSGIMALLVEAVQTELSELHQNGVNVQFIGDKSHLPASVLAAMEKSEKSNIPDARMTLVIAMNYGGRWDIIQAAQQVVDAGEKLTEAALSERMATVACGGDPDLVIRTGSERRISNFLLWQAAYAELYFTSRLWPDFSENDLLKALHDYAQRERRFGALTLD